MTITHQFGIQLVKSIVIFKIWFALQKEGTPSFYYNFIFWSIELYVLQSTCKTSASDMIFTSVCLPYWRTVWVVFKLLSLTEKHRGRYNDVRENIEICCAWHLLSMYDKLLGGTGDKSNRYLVRQRRNRYVVSSLGLCCSGNLIQR